MNESERTAIIADCVARLQLSDYKAIKFAEGELSATEYEPIRIQRRALRQRINELEEQMESLTI